MKTYRIKVNNEFLDNIYYTNYEEILKKAKELKDGKVEIIEYSFNYHLHCNEMEGVVYSNEKES